MGDATFEEWLKQAKIHGELMSDAAMEEWRKQAEIHKGCFRLSDEQITKFKEWNAAHLAEKHPTPKSRYCGAAGGRLTWSFTPGRAEVVRAEQHRAYVF